MDVENTLVVLISYDLYYCIENLKIQTYTYLRNISFPIYSAMASEDAIIAQRLECALCFDLMKEPKFLSCAHTFCKDCLAQLYQCQRKRDQISCPVCRQTTRLQNGDVSRLQTNVPLKAMIGDVKSAKRNCTVCGPEEKSIATAYCQICEEYICDSCLEAHGKYRKNKDHEVTSMDDINKGKVKVKRFCHAHPQEEKLWVCSTCNCFICFRCRMLEHNEANHKLEKVTEFQKRMKDQIESLKKKAWERVKSFENHMKIAKEQDVKIELKIDEIITDINEAFDDSIQQLTKKRNELIGQCHEIKNKLKTQLCDVSKVSQNDIDCITSASDLVSNGMKTILEGETLVVHTALCGELENMLGKDGPDDSEALAVARQTQDMEFTRYWGSRELDLGQVKRKWELINKIKTYPLSGSGPWDINPTRDGGMAVGYYGGGLEMFAVNGPMKRILQDVKVERIATLSDGRYIIRDRRYIIRDRPGVNTTLTMYTKDWKRESVTFHTPFVDTGALCVDYHNNIYVGNYHDKKIAVFRPEGGAPIKEITSPGLGPSYIRHMNHVNLLVVTDQSTVRVIDEEGIVKHDVSKDGYHASIAVLQDDSILIAWRKDGVLTIDLYTPQLKYVRTVLSKFKFKGTNWCLAEFSTGEIAFPDNNNLHVFRKT